MTDACFQAKEWLNRNRDVAMQLAADKRLLEIIENRLSSGVARYDHDGSSGSRDSARASHEDLLADYSELRRKIEREETQYLREVIKTRRVIDHLSKPILIAIAVDRYINGLRWTDIADLEHLSQAQVYRYHGDLLIEISSILNREK